MRRRHNRTPWKMVRVSSDAYHIDYGPYMWTVARPVSKNTALAFIRWAIAEERSA